MDNSLPQCEPDFNFLRLRRRDREEVDRWFGVFSDPVYSFIFYRVGRGADLAGDVAQETFVTALETMDRFDPDRGEMFPWLMHIARNCIRKALRRRGKDGIRTDFWKTVDRRLARAMTNLDSGILPEELLERK
jgi:RNA polymerase sigma factor (sigma-70 family)